MRKGKSTPGTKSLLIKTLGVLLALVVGFPLAAVLEAADSYPSKPVRFIIGSGVGGDTDFIGRLMATRLSERLGKTMVAENIGGGGGSISAELVMRAKPDGYTLLFTASHHILYPLLYKADYDALKSFIPIAKMGTETMCLVVHPSLPVHSVQELIALAKKQPGQLLMSVAGVGSFGHFETADFMSMAGIDMKQVMFKGAGAMLLDTLGGHSQVSITGPTITLGHIQDGKLRALATTGSNRNKVLPHVPTISEAGVPGFEAALWWAIFAPLGTPQAIVDRLSKEITAIMNSEETKNAFEKVGADPDLMGPAEMVKLFEKETAKYAKLVKEGKIKAE